MNTTQKNDKGEYSFMDSTGIELFNFAYQSGQEVGLAVLQAVFWLTVFITIGKLSGRL